MFLLRKLDLVSHIIEEGVGDGISCRNPLRVINCQHLGQQVEAILINKVLVLDRHKLVPVFFAEI